MVLVPLPVLTKTIALRLAGGRRRGVGDVAGGTRRRQPDARRPARSGHGLYAGFVPALAAGGVDTHCVVST